MKPYWFKPKRFWGWFAPYYPVSWQGWGIALFFLVREAETAGACPRVVQPLLYSEFVMIDSRSHSVSDTLYGISFWFVLTFILFDIAT